jgi:hypothetical protein
MTSTTYRTESLAPDLVYTEIFGDIDAESLQAMMIESRRLTEGTDFYGSVVDISKLGNITAEARRYAKGIPDEYPEMRVVVLFGGSFAQRILTKLVIKAMNFAARRPIKFEFADSKDVALEQVNALLAEGRADV